MLSDVNDQRSAAESSHHGVRRRRRHPRSRWSVVLRPYRRELKTFALFCAVLIISYYLWTALISK